MLQWTKDHERLYQLLKQELHIMRKLSDNIEQEEFFILTKNKCSEDAMLKERAALITTLNITRSYRLSAINKLKILQKLAEGKLEDLLPAEHEKNWEMVSMRDHIITLLDRINFQNNRNAHLNYACDHPLLVTRKSKKPILTITCEYKEM